MPPSLSNPPKSIRNINMRRSSHTQAPKSNPLNRRNSSGNFLGTLFAPKSRTPPIFSFGLVADIQYALKDPQIKTCKSGPSGKLDRRMGWSESLSKVKEAVNTWNKSNSLSFVLSLGDIIEGNESYMQHLSERELKAVLSQLNKSAAPVKHILGNHCRRISKPKLLPLLGLDASGSYYHFQPAAGWRFICLDTTEICGAAVDAGSHERTLISKAIATYKRPDHAFHGMISRAQMQWLARTLATSASNQESVIIASHYPLLGARTGHLALNSDDILRTIHESNADVVAVFAGHDHSGASVMPSTKEHTKNRNTAHITIPALLESPADGNAFATVAVYEDGSVDVAGYGTVPTHRIRRSNRRKK